MAAPVWNVGDQPGASDFNDWFTNIRLTIKPNNQNRSSAPGLQDDQDLVQQVDASKTYDVRIFAALTSPSAAGFLFNMNAPSGAVLYGNWKYFWRASSGLDGDVYDGVVNFLARNVTLTTPGGGVPAFLEIVGKLVMAGSAGQFRFRWAQANSNASNTTVYAGSSMDLRRVS